MQGRRIIDSPEAARLLFAPALQRAPTERLHVAHLDGSNGLIGLRMRFGADRPAVEFPLRAIMADAVRLESDALLLAHNHPSGDPMPTHADIATTRELVRAAKSLGIGVRDHLIFAGNALVSFRSLGLL